MPFSPEGRMSMKRSIVARDEGSDAGYETEEDLID